jgi:heme/copper-type cytochrome/quinol oxidase subunit 1
MTAIPAPQHAEAIAHAGPAHQDGGHEAHEHRISFVKKYLFSTDHKVIGLQFLFLGLFFLVVGGLLALVVRWQLAYPNATIPGGYKPVPVLSTMLWGGTPDKPAVMPSEVYNQFFTMHATIMIFLVIIPLLVGTFGNYLIPLKIGAPDMAFPYLNGAAFWLAVPAGGLLVASFFLPGGPAQAGWTSYPTLSELWPSGEGAVPIHAVGALKWASPTDASPLDHFVNILRLYGTNAAGEVTVSNWPRNAILPVFGGLLLMSLYLFAYAVRLGSRPLNWLVAFVLATASAYGCVKLFQFLAFDGQSAWFFAIFLLGFSSILGAVNYLTTIVKLRAPGMTFFRLPLSVWSLFVTSLIVLLGTPVLAAALFMNLMDHHRFTTFFLPFNWEVAGQPGAAGGGFPILHQHLFWFYSHPAVYIMILPAMGMVSDIMAVFSRKPIFGYRPMIYAMAAIAFLGFIVWAHHMFQSGMNPTLGTTFAVSTMLIAVPSAIKTFNWLGTLWRGNIQFTTPMLHAITFVAMFVVGGLSGIFMASTAVDVFIHDTYFIVAHIHYVLFGGSLFGLFAAITFWYPKMFGRMMSEWVGKLHWFLTFVTFNCVFFPMHMLGMRGMSRRVADYTNFGSFADLLPMNQFITYAALAMGVVQVLFVLNFVGSWVFGKKAGRNPWNATTLEWETASPPPHGNFESTPVVYHGPYEYSSPLVEEDWLAQTRKVEGDRTPVVALAGAH